MGPNEGKGVGSLGETVTSTKRMVADWRCGYGDPKVAAWNSPGVVFGLIMLPEGQPE